MRAIFIVPVAAVVIAQACGGTPDDQLERKSVRPTENTPTDPITAFTAVATRTYMRQLAPYFVSRELEPPELAAIEADKFKAIAPMLEAWTKNPAFPLAARRLISAKLSVSGTRDGIDFDLPGNLAEYVVRENLPFSTVLTADYCIDAKGAKRDCDTGAPFKAGVLSTRAFMVSRASRFNLTRASTMMRTFACQHYPLKETLEPRITRERLIPLFQVDREEADASVTFGNGSACYACHGQFSHHSQLFVRFDDTGMYRENATGIQDPAGELGRSTNGLFASHLKEPAEAKDHKSQMLGKEVADLKEAARVLAEAPTFVSCQVTNLLEYGLRLPPTAKIAPEVLDEIAGRARAGADPTFARLVIDTFSHPRIVAAVVEGVEP